MNTLWQKLSLMVIFIGVPLLVGGATVSAADEVPSPQSPEKEELGTRGGLLFQSSPTQPVLKAMPSVPPPSPCWKNIQPPYEGQYVPPTHYHTVSAAAFSLSSQPAPGVHFQYKYGTSVRTWRDANHIANHISFAAPLFLPQGAVIRQVEVFLKDDDPQYNLNFSLGETIAATGTDLGPFGAMLSLSSDCVKTAASAIVLLNRFAVPINSQRAYWMSVEWDVNNLNNATFDSGIHLHFVRLGYTLQ